MAYQIITDTACDFPAHMYAELDLITAPLAVLYKGETYTEYTEQWLKAMFDGLRSGESATTSAVNPDGWSSVIEPVLQSGKDVLVLAFSSGLSATYQSAVIAATELQEKYPEQKIRVVDTLCASLGQGLLVWYACKLRDSGMTLDELTAWCETNRNNLCHWFTVDDLMCLKRGGRIGAASAMIGTMLQIKPVLKVNEEGRLVNTAKVRGRKASIDRLVSLMGDSQIPGANDTVFICHGDCLADAEYLAAQVKEKYGVKEVLIYYVGAAIGAHSGPGTLALFYLGTQR